MRVHGSDSDLGDNVFGGTSPALGSFREYVEGETLALRLDVLLLPENQMEQDLLDSLPSVKEQVAGATRFEMKIAGELLVLYISRGC